MEPRPQQPRQPSGGQPQPPGQASSGGSQPPSQPPPPSQGPENQGFPEGYDPTTVVAPPRADYDYSPLDLAPPGQRRRRQLIAGAIGALSVVLIGALIVFGWMLVRDDPADDDPEDRVAAVTQTPEANEAAGDDDNVVATPPATTEAPTEPAAEPTAPQATEPPAEEEQAGDVATDEDGLTALLPDGSSLPPGFGEGADASRNLEEVTNALGASRIAEQNLANWGWTANVERTFANPEAEPGATGSIIVSLHGFQDAASAAEALPFFTEILINLGYYDVDAPQIGEDQRMLRMDQEDGLVYVTLYVQEGPVMYRFIGVAMEGDPTQDVIDIANQTLGVEQAPES